MYSLEHYKKKIAYYEGNRDRFQDGLGRSWEPIEYAILIEKDENYWGAVRLIVVYNSFEIEQTDGDYYKIDDDYIYLLDTEGSSGGGFYPGNVTFKLPLKYVGKVIKKLSGKRNVKESSFTFSG